METRSELVQLLSRVMYRVLTQRKILTPQNLADSEQDGLAQSPTRLLNVTTTVNSTNAGENHT